MNLKQDAEYIYRSAIAGVQPEDAVRRALRDKNYPDSVYVVAIGKAAWPMASAANDVLGQKIRDGVVITKYGHAKGNIGALRIFEAGHPVPDSNSYAATKAAIELVRRLEKNDLVLFLVSGGGSALFESPLIEGDEIAEITDQLLKSGADIIEMNTIRKRLSAVKGGRFAKLCSPAHIFAVILSDVIGDRPDMIASGPAYPDASTAKQAKDIVKKYALRLSAHTLQQLEHETPKQLPNVESVVVGSVRLLCDFAHDAAVKLGYETIILTDSLCCHAADAGQFLAAIARFYSGTKKSMAFLAGGETVVRLTGSGLGGRNQELALAAAQGISGLEQTAVFSFGSDGTDGPTDAAGGYVCGDTAYNLAKLGITISDVLADNDSYHALKACCGLIFTGPTGTNVNDLSVILIKRD